VNNRTFNALKYMFIIVIGGFVFGVDAGIISGTVKFIRAEFMLSDLEVGTVVSAPALGAVIALLFSSKLVDYLGRKKMMILIALFYLVSAISSTFAPNYATLVLARMLGGMAFCSLSITSMYVGETAPSKLRGKLVSMNQVMIGVGFFIAYLINYILILQVSDNSFFFSQENVWRTMLGSEIPAVLVWIGLLTLIPESPRWLMIKGKNREAQKVIELMNPADEVESVISEIQENITKTDCNTPLKQQFKTLFSRKMKLVLIIGVGLAVVQSFSGMGAISYYAPTIFEQVGLGEKNAFLQTALLGFISIIFSLIAVGLVDRLGRKFILVIGLLVISACHLTISYGFNNATYSITEENIAKIEKVVDTTPLQASLGTVFHSDIEFKQQLREYYSERDVHLYEGAMIKAFVTINPIMIIIAIFAFKAAFFFSIGPVMWVVFSEITPNAIRSVAIPAFALIASLMAFFVQRFFPWQLATFGASDTFLLYAISSGLGVLLVIFILPETKNKSLEQIEAILVGEDLIPQVSDLDLGEMSKGSVK
jgi:SP family arabinose:H+ symporter-like MFS transporter